jgi:hypothetical protein
MDQAYKNILGMSNKEAAEILKNFTPTIVPGRGAGMTSLRNFAFIIALNKAIAVLESTKE